MSVLNQSGEEQVECPLCMEPLEVDDLNFYPCTCGYQICRFCWHRIRTDENGLCPACRKAYSENPADFIPLSQEQVAKLKAEKRQRDQQRKAKLSESRKHLASVRVVQRNLVFVVGLPMRLADPEVLKRHEYFGKFGKIHKVVINQSTSYAGSQGPSASAYVTYVKSDDALRAIQSVNNITIDGRLIKSSLGTTKYCSHFMKNQACPKADCMYLHDFGDPEASFTKEQMHAGKHQEYEKKLHEALLQRTQSITPNNNSNCSTSNITSTTNTTVTTTMAEANSKSSTSANSTTNKINNSLNNNEKEKSKKGKTKNGSDKKENKKDNGIAKDNSNSTTNSDKASREKDDRSSSSTSPTDGSIISDKKLSPPLRPSLVTDDNSSFFSSNTFHKINPDPQQHLNKDNGISHSLVDDSGLSESVDTQHTTSSSSSILTDSLLNVNTSEDWAAAFGFNCHSDQLDLNKHRDDCSVKESFNSGFGHENDFIKGTTSFHGLYDKLHDGVDIGKPPNGYNTYKPDCLQPSAHMTNGLDRNMSKFFMDFHKNNKDLSGGQYMNGFSDPHPNHSFFNSHVNSQQSSVDRMMLLQQKQLEEQLVNLTLGKNLNIPYQNGVTTPRYMNGDMAASHKQNMGYDALSGMYMNNSTTESKQKRSSEDELDFDPFQETQKAFAELMASEQNSKNTLSGRGTQINGIVRNNQNNSSQLRPPPGFMQSNTHMNSFGSKILPFLSMSNSQQQINNSSQNSWPSEYNPPLQDVQQHKSINNPCNDWKILDPAILSSSRHYPLANYPMRDHYINNIQLGNHIQQQPPQQQLNNGHHQLRPFEYTSNNAFSNFTQQLQPSLNNLAHMNSQPLNWFNDLNSQISSPPGFRNNQTSKQQEC